MYEQTVFQLKVVTWVRVRVSIPTTGETPSEGTGCAKKISMSSRKSQQQNLLRDVECWSSERGKSTSSPLQPTCSNNGNDRNGRYYIWCAMLCKQIHACTRTYIHLHVCALENLKSYNFVALGFLLYLLAFSIEREAKHFPSQILLDLFCAVMHMRCYWVATEIV